MAIIQKGEYWYIRYDDAWGHQRQEKVSASKKQAEALFRQRMVERAEIKKLGGEKQKKLLPVSLSDFSRKYLEYSKLNKKPKMLISEKNSLKHILGYFNIRYISDITPADIEAYKQQRKDTGVSNATINRELTCINTMLNMALEWGIISERPIRKIKKLKESEGRVRYLTPEELIALLSQCAEHIKPLAIISLETGMRKGELMSLRWKDCDFAAGILHVHEQLQEGVRQSTKSGKRRDVPMSPAVREILEQIPRNAEEVFHDWGNPRTAFENACRRAGIKDFHWHDMRHTAGTYMMMEGASPRDVMEILGLHSFEMVLKYTHSTEGSRKTAIMALSNKYKGMISKTAPE